MRMPIPKANQCYSIKWFVIRKMGPLLLQFISQTSFSNSVEWSRDYPHYSQLICQGCKGVRWESSYKLIKQKIKVKLKLKKEPNATLNHFSITEMLKLPNQ